MRMSILTLCLVVINVANGANQNEGWKVDLGFATWPGKAAALKAGFIFRQGEYPMLSGLQVDSDEVEISNLTGVTDIAGYQIAGNSIVVRKLVLKSQSGQVRIRIGVALDSTDLAQERLIVHYFLGRSIRGVNGRVEPPTYGDVLFENTGSVAFVRNNVFVVLIADGGLDIKSVGQAIDAKIVSTPDHTLTELSALRPVINKFSATPATIRRWFENRPSGVATLNIETSDPSNQSVKILNIDASGKLLISKDGNAWKASPTLNLGTFPIGLSVVNESLLFSISTTNVTVEE